MYLGKQQKFFNDSYHSVVLLCDMWKKSFNDGPKALYRNAIMNIHVWQQRPTTETRNIVKDVISTKKVDQLSLVKNQRAVKWCNSDTSQIKWAEMSLLRYKTFLNEQNREKLTDEK